MFGFTVQALSFTKPGPSHTEFLVLCTTAEYLPPLLNPALNYIYCFRTVINRGMVTIAVCRKLKKGRNSTKIKHCYKVLSQPIHSGAGRWHLERLCILMLSVTFLLIVELYLTLGGTTVRSFSEAPCFNPLRISTNASYKCQTTSLGISLVTSLPISIQISQLRFAAP